ncbi:DNA replication protein dnaD [Chlamydia abortus]|uniref:DnaD domain protein n=1 Tax=Paenibacillus residui TaxID=629724 RepID=A0ABW3D344_9BACL|nr:MULTISPECIES: DnaD domain protein [Paenibacillaceae]SHE10984.1 DNA replication protein dnaD [Chlamydia abortus]
MNNKEFKRLEEGVLAALQEGTLQVPHLFFKLYPGLNLNETEAMLLLHLMSFIDREKKDFPTIEEIQSRMAAPPEQVIKALQKLLKEGWITIDEEVDSLSGIQYERYNLSGMYHKLAAAWADFHKEEERQKRLAVSKEGNDIFTIFENEFARPLTPMELETISGWLDQDKYNKDLILAALKEAVFAGKVHFRYIDRILLEWSRNRIFTPEQAKEHAQRFRGAR